MDAPAAFLSHDIRGGEVRAGVKPAGQKLTARKDGGLAGKVRKNHLRHVLRHLRVAVDLPQCRRVNQANMASHQLRERILGLRLRVTAKQFAVQNHRHFLV